jgi:hypothetical protein
MGLNPFAAVAAAARWLAKCSAHLFQLMLYKTAAVKQAKAAVRAAHAREEAATMHYLLSCTRYCPKCKSRIIKDGGCEHMECLCGRSFNWSEAGVGQPY